jgi:hypothetical protein
MDIELTILDLMNFTSRDGNDSMSFNADFNLKFYVNEPNGTNDLAIEIILKNFYFNFNAEINDMNIHPKLIASILNEIDIVSSTIGNFDTREIIALF